VWCVPEEAVVRSGNGQAVFTANVDGSYTMVPLTTGANEYGYIELVEPSDRTARTAAGGEGRIQPAIITKEQRGGMIRIEMKIDQRTDHSKHPWT
jgi:hypothetical protein